MGKSEFGVEPIAFEMLVRFPVGHVFLGNVALFEEFSSFHLLLVSHLT